MKPPGRRSWVGYRRATDVVDPRCESFAQESLKGASGAGQRVPIRLSAPRARTDNVRVKSATKPPRVLVVDDVDGSRDLIREILESDGIEVVGEADTGESAVRLAEELRPDVVLMDVRMKGMDGIEATRRIKEVLPSVHVIILSVFDDTPLLKEAVNAGASAHVTKGSAGSRLSAQVLSVCGMTSANA